jgi:hypothetical protein
MPLRQEWLPVDVRPLALTEEPCHRLALRKQHVEAHRLD